MIGKCIDQMLIIYERTKEKEEEEKRTTPQHIIILSFSNVNEQVND